MRNDENNADLHPTSSDHDESLLETEPSESETASAEESGVSGE